MDYVLRKLIAYIMPTLGNIDLRRDRALHDTKAPKGSH